MEVEKIKAAAQDSLKDVVGWRRHLHEHPEVGFDLKNTMAYVCSVLDELGVEHEANEKGSCVVAYINRGKPGKIKNYSMGVKIYTLEGMEWTGAPEAAPDPESAKEEDTEENQ